MGKYYTPPTAALDGDTAYAKDVNDISTRVNTGLIQVDADIVASTAVSAAWAAKAEKWAEELEDVEVEAGKYSAMHWAIKSTASASAASTSASNAATSAFNAATSETNAATSETNAGTSETNAATSEANAAASATSAATSETNAATSETNAAASETNAATSETNADADATATAADRVQTGLDATQTAADRVQTGLDVTSSGNSASAASTSESNALASENKAEEWAEKPEDTQVETGKYSALHWAAKAAASAGVQHIVGTADEIDVDESDLNNPIVSISPNFRRQKNLIINGAGRVNQRVHTHSTAITSGDYYVDRISALFSTGSWAGMHSILEDEYMYGIYSSAGSGALGAADYVSPVSYKIEGNDLTQLLNGGNLTFSFNVRCSSAGTYPILLVLYEDATNNWRILKEFTVNTADIVESKSVTFTIPDGYIGDRGADKGATIIIGANQGSNYNLGAADTWYYNSTGGVLATTTNWTNDIDAQFRIGSFQVEIGESATPFEQRSFGEELALCERYYWQSTPNYELFGNTVANTGRTSYHYFPTTMRVAPTMAVTNITGSLTPTLSIVRSKVNGYGMVLTNTGGSGALGYVSYTVTADAEL